MIKRLLISFVLFIIFFMPLINAGVVSVSPTHFQYFFKPNMEENITIRAYSSEPNQTLGIYVVGDLSNYTKINKTEIVGKGSFLVNIKLPNKIEVPGNHRILLGVIEKSENSGGIGAVAAVQASVDIMVPYPGKYTENTLTIANINEKENSSYTFVVNNLGTDDIVISPILYIKNYNKTILFSQNLETVIIKSGEKTTFTGSIDTSNLLPGVYYGEVIFNYGNYGQNVSIEKEFNIGTFLMDINDYSYEFLEGKINKFYITSKNLWNSPMDDVFSTVSITDNGNMLDYFVTPSFDFLPWDVKNLTGFFDATNVSAGKYVGNIQIFYENKTTSKLVAIYVKKAEKTELRKTVEIVLVSGGLSILLLIIVIIYLTIKLYKRRKDGKKS